MIPPKPGIVHGLLSLGLFLHAAGLLWIWGDDVYRDSLNPHNEYFTAIKWGQFIVVAIFFVTCVEYARKRRESLVFLVGFFVFLYGSFTLVFVSFPVTV